MINADLLQDPQIPVPSFEDVVCRPVDNINTPLPWAHERRNKIEQILTYLSVEHRNCSDPTDYNYIITYNGIRYSLNYCPYLITTPGEDSFNFIEILLSSDVFKFETVLDFYEKIIQVIQEDQREQEEQKEQ